MPNPNLISVPFSRDGEKNTIPLAGAPEPQLATMTGGFPEITEQKISEGGIPPERADFNGLGYLTTSHLEFLNKGNWYEFDHDFALSIGGYQINARLRLTNGDIVKSTIDGNTNDPNTDMTGWVKDNSASQIFDDKGNNQQTINNYLQYVNSWGAIGDGTLHTLQEWVDSGKFSSLTAIQFIYPSATALTNSIDRVAIQACIDYCRDGGKTAFGVSGSNYYIDLSIKMYSDSDFTGSTFTVDSSFSSQVVRVSSTDLGVSLLSFLNIKLPSILNNRVVGNIPSVGGVGVFLEGVRNSIIVFTGDVRGFETNLKLYSDDVNKYISYNSLYFGGAALRGSRTNILVEVTGTGWINECQWFGGQFAQFSQDSAAFETKGLWVKKTLGGNNAPNGHTFYGCSIEGNYAYTLDFDYDASITTSFFSLNRFNDCRFEAATKFRFNQYSLYDAMNNCYVPDSAVFENSVYPLIDGSGRFANKYIDVAALENGSNFRTSKRTYIYQASNSASAVPLSAGFQNRLNGGIRANGNHVVYDAADETKLYPMLEMGKLSATPSINFGSGVAAPTDRIFWNATGDLRHNAGLSPSSNNAFDLGASGRAYKTVWSTNARFTQGFSVWATVPPSSKPSITGKITPATIAEQNAVLSSIISALVSYGLVSDDRT